MHLVRKIAFAAVALAVAAAVQPAHAVCANPYRITSINVDAGNYSYVYTPGCGNAGCSPGNTSISGEFGGVFWAIGAGDEAIGFGADNGTFQGRDWMYLYPGYPASIHTNWAADPGIDGCIDTTPTRCMAIVFSDVTPNTAETAVAVLSSGWGNFAQPGSLNINLVPAPPPTITATTCVGDTGVVLDVGAVDAGFLAAGSYLDPSCPGGLVAGIRYYTLSLPAGSAPPSDTKLSTGGWTNSGVEVPFGVPATLTVPCTGGGRDIYIAYSLLNESGMPAPNVVIGSTWARCGPNCGPQPLCEDPGGFPQCGLPCPDPNDRCEIDPLGGDFCRCDPVLCEDPGGFPQCDSPCPDPSDVCTNTGNECLCLPAPPVECEEPGAFPQCDLPCPNPNDICTNTGLDCTCLTPPPVECEDFGGFPQCDLPCRNRTEICVNTGTACVCEPRPPIAVDAATFLAPCREGRVVHVVEDTEVSGAAQIRGPCGITLGEGGLELRFVDADLIVGSLVLEGRGTIALERSRILSTHDGILFLVGSNSFLEIADSELDAATYMTMDADRTYVNIDHATLRASTSITLKIRWGELRLQHTVLRADTDKLTLQATIGEILVDRSALYAPLGGLSINTTIGSGSSTTIAIADSVIESLDFVSLRARDSGVEILRSELRSQRGTVYVSSFDVPAVVHDSLLTTNSGKVVLRGVYRSPVDLRRSRLIAHRGSIDISAHEDVTVTDNEISSEGGSVNVYAYEALTVADNEISATYDVSLKAAWGSAQVDHNEFQALNLELLVPEFNEGECTCEFNEPKIVCSEAGGRHAPASRHPFE